MEIIVRKGMQDDVYGTFKSSDAGRRTAQKTDWVEGVWENIAPHPIRVRDKYELKKVCQYWSQRTGRVIIPKAFAKRSSQGNGLEWSF